MNLIIIWLNWLNAKWKLQFKKNKLETKEEKPTAFVEQRLMSNLVIDRWNSNLHKHSPRTAIVEEDGWYVQKKGKLCLNDFGKCGCNVLANAKLKWSIRIVVSAPWKRKRVWRKSSFWPCRCFVYYMTPKYIEPCTLDGFIKVTLARA